MVALKEKELDGRNEGKEGLVPLSLQRCMGRKEVCRWALVTPLTFESAATTWLEHFLT